VTAATIVVKEKSVVINTLSKALRLWRQRGLEEKDAEIPCNP